MKTKWKKILGILMAVTLFISVMPKAIYAEEPGVGYGYEILVEPSVAAIGGEVTLTVRLTDYDETKSGIEGFQIDIKNRENILQNAVCTSLVTDKQNLLADDTGYQPNRNLVRHLYMKMSGTMDYSVSDLLEVKIPIDKNLTEAGTVELPLQLLIASEDGGQYTYDSTVVINYAPASEVSNVDITWGAMDFTYQEGQWQPSSHSYVGGGWIANDDSNTFTITNNGDSAVTAHMSYATERTDISGKFSDGTTVANEMTAEIEAKKSQTSHLILEGKPSEEMDKLKIGTVTVTLE